jgi:hypothetical protein
MEFSGLVSFVYVKSVHVDQEFGKFCGAPYVAEGIIQLSKIRQVVRHIADWASAERLPTRDEDSTATAGIRWTVWRWAFVFIGRGRWKERDRGFVVWGGTAPFGGQGSRLHEGDDLSALNFEPKK